MPIGYLYWIILVIWFLFGLWSHRGELRGGDYFPLGGSLVLFILLALLGWRLFGPVVR